MNVWQKKIIELEETIARIRAETAKNSGEVAAGKTLVPYAHCCNGPVKYCDCVNPNHGGALVDTNSASLYATPANSRAEAIRECIDAINALHQPDLGMEPYGLADALAALEDLLDNPQPDSRAEAIGVKPLEWKAVRKAVIGADGYEITDMSAGNKQGWRGSFPGENTYRWFSTIEDAQDAAQGHYISRRANRC